MTSTTTTVITKRHDGQHEVTSFLFEPMTTRFRPLPPSTPLRLRLIIADMNSNMVDRSTNMQLATR